LVLQSGSLTELLTRLRVHTLDVILSNRRVQSTADDPWRCRRIARQPVSLVGPPALKKNKRSKRAVFEFPDSLADVPVLLPGPDNDIRGSFDLLCEQLGVRYRLRAEVDDMALLRLLARDSDSVALVPTVVVQDELRSGRLVEYGVVPDLYENFYAITVQRHFELPLVKELLKRPEAEVLGIAAA
jgi:LysR family transcriptional regulator, transcriptional activator of nhaA